VYTDVDGVKTADPRIAPEAATLARLSYSEVVELAHLGAKVIHPRAVEIAMGGQLPLQIRPTATDAPGTLVTDEAPGGALEQRAIDRPVTGIAHVSQRAQVVVDVPPEGEGRAAPAIFTALGDAGISVDMINVTPERISFI